jgi:hypothetical protein
MSDITKVIFVLIISNCTHLLSLFSVKNASKFLYRMFLVMGSI